MRVVGIYWLALRTAAMHARPLGSSLLSVLSLAAVATIHTELLAQRPIPSPKVVRAFTLDGESLELAAIGSALVLSDESLVLTDLPSKRVILISGAGSPVAIAGGEGRAPGRLLSLSAIGLESDTVLWAIDNVQRRLVKWQLPTLKHLSTSTFEREFPWLADEERIVIRARDRNGSLVLSPSWRYSPGNTLAGVDSLWIRKIDGKRVSLAPLRWDRQGMVLAGGRSISTYQPFNDNALLATSASGNRVFTVIRSADERAKVQVRMFDRGGMRSDTSSLDLPMTPLSGRTVDSVINSYAASLQADRLYASTDAAARDVRRALFVPEYLPPIAAALADREGRGVWLSKANLSSESAEWVRFDAISRSISTSIRLDSSEAALAFSDNVVWTQRQTGDGDIIISKWRFE